MRRHFLVTAVSTAFLPVALAAAPLLLAACSGGDDDTGDDDDAPVDCSTRPTDIPTARGEVEGAFSPVTGQFVFFGGDEGIPVNCQSQTIFRDDTWVYEEDCGNWREIEGSAPPAASRYAAGYDSVRDRFVIFGGRFRNGTSGPYTLRDTAHAYSFADETWSDLPDGPSARAIHAGVVAGDRFVIHGGTGSTDGANYNPVYDETWILDLANETWEQLDTTDGPGGRIFHAMATDGADKVWLYGGGDINAFFGPFYSDVWELDLSDGTWTELHDGGRGAPEGRIGPDMHYDEANNQLLIWAGHDITDLGNNNQLHAFDLGSKSFSTVRAGDVLDAGSNGFCDFPADFVAIEEDTPERRYLAASAMTPDGRMYTFGGKTDCGIINDMWSYDVGLDAWTMHTRATDGESCVRAYDDCSSLCF
jgi:hypothetical protein